MTPEQEKLRQTAAGLRFKAHSGLAASAAARDLSVLLPRALTQVVDGELSTGKLQERWAKAWADAKAALEPPADDGEVLLAALSDILAWHQQQAALIATRYLEKIEGERRALEGRAAGIEEALGVLSP